MKIRNHKRLFALLLVLALVVGMIPSALADNEPDISAAESTKESLVDSMTEAEPVISPPMQSIIESDEAAEEAEDSEIEPAYEAPTSMDGETLTRMDNGGIMLLGGGGTMGKSTCVTFAAYQSGRWKCHRYEVDGSHSYGHYFYTSEIAYHTIDGVDLFCIEPNTSSLGGQYYTAYTAEEASSSSYWKLELDDLQRSHIQKILAFGYPQVDYGYSRQVQYAATQVLIWEVVSQSRVNADIKSCTDYGLYSKVYDVLGADFQSCYDGILNAISVSDGTVPSFAGSYQSNAKSITLTLNNSTGCYEGSVRDNNSVLSHFTFSASGVNFSRSGNTLYISVPAANADAIKGQVITGTSDQKLMSTSNPTIWENPTYQTVLTSGGADYLHAYINLTWEDAPKTGSLVVSKAVNYGSWSGFTFRLHGTSDNGNSVDVTATTGSDGKAYFKDIEIGTYTLEEISPDNAYILPEPQTVTIPGNDVAYATMENVWKHWRAAITKVDADTSKASPQGDATLSGAEYTLYKSGKAVATYTVSNGGFTTDLFPCTKDDGIYTLKETKAPAGYKLDETVYTLKTSYDHYSNAENSFSLTVSDPVIQGKIQLTKYAVNTVSGDKQPEEGATFTVYLKSAGSYDKAKDSERDIITIGKDGKGTSKSLPYGVYCVQQRTGWAGYDQDETVYEVTISKDGQTVKKDNSGHDLTIYNNIWTGKLSILKVDGADNTPLAGAVFTLSGSDGSDSTLTTGKDGTVTFENLVFGVTYVWKEVQAPKGYLLNEDNTGIWSVEEHDAEIQYTAKNDRRPGIRGEPHTYTEDDYAFIKDLWSKEKIQGAEPRYWEDVQIGEEPTWTCDGPTTATDLMSYHPMGSMGIMMVRRCMTEGNMRGLVKDPYNMYYHDTALHYCNLNIGAARPYHFNTTCRNQILRMITNWMGDAGQVRSIGWRLGEEQKEGEAWNKWPEGFARESWLLKVPALKEAGRFMAHHAMVGDLSICKGYVYDKYEENGESFVEMACWTETIEGYITQECRAVVKLPKRK